MSEENEKPLRLFSIEKEHAVALMRHSDEQLEMIADLLSTKSLEDPIDLKVVSLLCEINELYAISKKRKANTGSLTITFNGQCKTYLCSHPKSLTLL